MTAADEKTRAELDLRKAALVARMAAEKMTPAPDTWTSEEFEAVEGHRYVTLEGERVGTTDKMHTLDPGDLYFWFVPAQD